MKALILGTLGVILSLGFVTDTLAADCSNAATQAASVATLQSDVYYHCSKMDTTYEDKQQDYIVNFACVGETGSGVLSYRVSFTNNDSCTTPTVISL